MNRSLSAVSKLATLALLSLGSCASINQHQNDHWNGRSVLPRASRFFLGYDGERDGSYRDFAWERKKSFNLIVRRYFLNHNPGNPYQSDVPSLYERRPANSLWPNPVNYIHGEGIIMGFVLLAGFGTFVPAPIDSLIGTFIEPGGMKEFTVGLPD
jgi:hypothetical protein